MFHNLDFTKFGHRERLIAAKLLTAWNEQGLPDDFINNEVLIRFNPYSADVYLINSDGKIAMLNGDKLEIYYTEYDTETGEEGFKDELSEEAKTRLNLN